MVLLPLQAAALRWCLSASALPQATTTLRDACRCSSVQLPRSRPLVLAGGHHNGKRTITTTTAPARLRLQRQARQPPEARTPPHTF